MKIKGATLTIKTLEEKGISLIAGIPGGANLPLYEALYDSSIQHILPRHEQSAGFIAQGQARITGKPAVCLVTSGPGATNLITAIGDAYLDSIPVIAISGQVSKSLLGKDSFQEADIFAMTKPITKANYFVEDARNLPRIIHEAFQIAASGRPGPVWIDIPKDVQLQEVREEDIEPFSLKKDEAFAISLEQIQMAAQMLEQAERPLIILGGGLVRSGGASLALQLARKQNIPAAATLMGLGAFPYFDPLYLGMLGMHAARYTNLLLSEADLILALGSRLDDRLTGKVEAFAPNAKLIHIDLDRAQLNKIKAADLAIKGDTKDFLQQITPLMGKRQRSAWLARVHGLKARFPFYTQEQKDFFEPSTLFQSLVEMLSPETIITTDVGQHQMWTAQFYPFQKPGKLLTSGGFGTMGFGLPTAIGAALAAPDKKVVCISGDGSLLMNIQELITLSELNLNVKILLLDNQALGLVRQQQELFFAGRKIASEFHASPDFPLLARAMGVQSIDLGECNDPGFEMKQFLSNPGPGLIRIPMSQNQNVYPIVPPGKANTQMLCAKEK